MKKKIFYIIIGIAIMLFMGCKGNEKEDNFIPDISPVITEDDIYIPDDPIDDFEEPTKIPEEEPEFVGEATTKYVKLLSYGAVLNVRSAPNSEESNIVGFLVHTEPVEVISIENDWAEFWYNGEVRYVSSEFLVDFVPPYISPPMLPSGDN